MKAAFWGRRPQVRATFGTSETRGWEYRQTGPLMPKNHLQPSQNNKDPKKNRNTIVTHAESQESEPTLKIMSKARRAPAGSYGCPPVHPSNHTWLARSLRQMGTLGSRAIKFEQLPPKTMTACHPLTTKTVRHVKHCQNQQKHAIPLSNRDRSSCTRSKESKAGTASRC